MPYLNSDDEFPEHPKIDPLSDGAFRLHVSGMHYSAKKLTDGIVPHARVARLTPNYRPGHLTELLKAGVWHKGGEGCGTEHCLIGEPSEYVIHDYLEWNKPAAWWNERRRKEAERKAAYRRKKAAAEQDSAKGLRSV